MGKGIVVNTIFCGDRREGIETILNPLDRHALEAVARWRFEPARKGDEAVEQWLVVNVDY